jgi:hypothetical protein
MLEFFLTETRKFYNKNGVVDPVKELQNIENSGQLRVSNRQILHTSDDFFKYSNEIFT